jgi:hypothetical protein
MAQKKSGSMTKEEIAVQKLQAIIFLGVGVAALIASYGIGYFGPHNSVSVMTELMLTAMFLGCFFVAAMKAIKLNKTSALK